MPYAEMHRSSVFLALGANLGDPASQLAEATRRVAGPQLEVMARSRLYRSAPVGPPGQPDYLNAVIEVQTSFSPTDLLKHTQAIENAMGRVKSVRWGPRVVDIDIALYGDEVVHTPDLVIPHRELARRRFVLAPLADIAPDLIVPGLGKSVAQLLSELVDDPSDLMVLTKNW